MNTHITQDDIIYFVVTDRFFGRNKRTVAESDTSIHGGTLDGIRTSAAMFDTLDASDDVCPTELSEPAVKRLVRRVHV